MVTPADADTINSIVQGGTNYGADSRVHAGGVAAAGKYTDPVDRRFQDNQILSCKICLNLQLHSLLLKSRAMRFQYRADIIIQVIRHLFRTTADIARWLHMSGKLLAAQVK